MIQHDLQERVHGGPFEPFRVKLVNGDHFDIFDSRTISVGVSTVFIAPRDQTWIVFPNDKILSVECLMADYHSGPPRSDDE